MREGDGHARVPKEQARVCEDPGDALGVAVERESFVDHHARDAVEP
jgi:hypothetical protein